MNQAPPRAKKILFLITKATWGGAQRYVFDLATHLPAEAYDVSLAYGLRGKLARKLEERGIRTYEIPAMGRDIAVLSDLASFFQILTLLRRVRPDVLHLNSSKAAGLGALAGRLAGVPRIISTAHGWPFKEKRGWFARGLIYQTTWLTVLCSHATTVVSQTDEKIGRRMLLAGKKVRFVPLGIERIDFLPRDEASSALCIAAGLPRIVTVAELTRNKDIRTAIDAVRALKDRNIPCRYFVIGEGELREALEEHAIEKGVENDVLFLGPVGNAAHFLKAFDIFLLPSIKEGMPYVLLEAAQAGLPIVATDAIDPSFKEEYPPTTLVPAGNAGAFADALERAIEGEKSPAPARLPALETMVERTAGLYR